MSSSQGRNYEQERRVLNILIDALYERNKDQFQDREQVFDVFGRAACTGDWVPLRNLIEQTFGHGTLAEIVRLEDVDTDVQEEFTKSLCAEGVPQRGTIGSVRGRAHEAKEKYHKAREAEALARFQATVKKLQEQQRQDERQQYEPTEDERIKREEQWAKEYLSDLGIEDWEFLRNKKILDLGARLGEFADIAKTHGIEIISVDKSPQFWRMMEHGLPRHEVPLVQGDAEHLPFADASFDLIISRAAPPSISQSKEEVINTISEVKRILKEGGEFRFGPGNLQPAILDDIERPLFTDQERENLTTDEKVARIRGKSIEFLKQIDPAIEEYATNNDAPQVTGFSDHCYILRKGEDSSLI